MMNFNKRPRLQIVDLGAHMVKALVVEPGADGALALVAAEAVALPSPAPDPDRALTGALSALTGLAKRTFTADRPVHVLGPESLVRGEIASLAGVPESALADVMATDRARFLRTFGTRQRSFGSSVRLKLARSGEMVDVTVAHAYARWVDLEELSHALVRAGLTLGSVLPRALACRELARRAAPPGTQSCVVADAGFASTSLMRIADGEPRRWRVVFAGGADFFREIAGQLQRAEPLDGAMYLAVMTRAGFATDEAGLRESGLTDEEARGVRAAFRAREAAYFGALRAGIEALMKSSAPAAARPRLPDGWDGEETGGPAPEPAAEAPAAEAPLPRVLFTGGLALVPGFLERARTYLGGTCAVLDPTPLAVVGRAPAHPLGLFGPSLGAAQLLAAPEAATGDVARDYVQLIAAQDAAAAHYTPMNRRFARAAAVAAVALVAGTGLLERNLAARADGLAAEIARERADLEPPLVMKELLTRFRDVRIKEVLADTRVRYVERLLNPRPDWGQLANALQAVTVPKALVLTEVTFDVHWPRSDGPSEPRVRVGRDLLVDAPEAEPRRAAEGKLIEVKIAGETDSLDTFRKFVADLEAKRLLSDVTYDTSARMSEGRAHGIEHHAHFAFTVTGYLDPSKHAES